MSNKYNSDFLKIMQERGFIYQCTNFEEVDKLLNTQSITGYNGFDPTGDSLHVGHLMPIMMLYWFQQTGHKPIVLIGGGTAKVGDPSGKDETRKLLDIDTLKKNSDAIKQIFSKFLKFGNGKTDACMVNNADWLDELKYIEFLRDYGKHFSVNRMLSMESVKTRLDREQSISFLEFNYMILQAYDFVELYRNYNCRLQLAGSDQWGNIINGVELARRIEQIELFGFTCPLLTTASGAKMGKTASGAVWLNSDKLSPYDYYQYWRNTEDADVGKFLRIFTILPLSEIEKLEQLQDAEINEAKKILAFEATKLCHGEQAAILAADTAKKTFEEGKASDADLPSIEVEKNNLKDGIPAFILLREAGLVSSSGEARRLIKGGGARVNDKKINNIDYKITASDIQDNNTIKLSAGKKKHAILKIAG